MLYGRWILYLKSTGLVNFCSPTITMADYKPIPSDIHKDEHLPEDKPNFAISKRCAFLYISILFNVISFSFILGKSDGLKAIFSNGIFGLDRIKVHDDSRTSHCPSSLPLAASPPVTLNLWASLTVPETSAIYTWLEAPERNLNLTRSRGSILTDNVVYGIETYYPPKSEALAYLDNSALSPPPARFARVTIHHGGVEVPAVVDYLVGPLPVGPRTTIRSLKEIYHRDDIPFNARGFSNIDEISSFLALETAPIAYVMEVGMPSVCSLLYLLTSSGTFRRRHPRL
jgi:primary-amine oxidase